MNRIYVSSEDLTSHASQVMSMKVEMSTLFEQMKSTIRSMSSFWSSPAAQACLAQFEALSPVFPQYTALVENYCTYLQQTAAAYQENEAALSAV